MEKQKRTIPPELVWMHTACSRISIISALDDQVPGGVYLCQVNDEISCGACCGLYNVSDLSRQHLTAMLAGRSERFARTERTPDAIDAFGRETERLEPQQRPFAQLHHCPFIGLIGNGPGRVGCLLHPRAEGNHGVDFRGLSYYGGMACRSYFCDTTKKLAPRWKRLMRQALNHWYLFGLVVTEKKLLTALFEHLETRLGRPLDPTRAGREEVAEPLRRLLGLKCRWPFRPPSHSTACHYLFNDNAHPKPPIPYEDLAVAPSDYDGILREMPSSFATPGQLRQAEALIESHLAAVAGALG